MSRLKIKIFFLVLVNFIFGCTTKNKFDKTITGNWQIDSTESYKQGIKQSDAPLKNYYWNFNEYHDLVFFNKDSIIQIHYFKLKDSLINCYNSKKDTSDWTFQLRLIKIQNDKIVLQSIYDDNSATKFFMTKTKIGDIKDFMKKTSSNLINDTTGKK